jgi:hypothetical protein
LSWMKRNQIERTTLNLIREVPHAIRAKHLGPRPSPS